MDHRHFLEDQASSEADRRSLPFVASSSNAEGSDADPQQLAVDTSFMRLGDQVVA